MCGPNDSAEGVHDPLAETVANLPLLLLSGGLLATLFPFACAIGILTLSCSAMFGVPELTLNETNYEGSWLLTLFGPVLLILGGLAAAFAFSIWTGKVWGRGLVILFWTSLIVFASLVSILYPTGGRIWFFVALSCVPILLVSWLYLYRWVRVVEYYKTLKADGGNDAQD
jgi:hypothetical protein